jgi:hypothetical protein
VFLFGQLKNNTINWGTWMSYSISVSTIVAADDSQATSMVAATTSQWVQAGVVVYQQSLNPGSHTFLLQHRVDGGTGTFSNRRIQVMGF